MSINTITYSDKSDINTTATPAVNKVAASNLNEIKSVVNSNANLMGDLSLLNTTVKSSVVNALNELEDSDTWKLLGSVTGNTSINLPASFKEILAIVKVDNNDNVVFSFVIPYVSLKSTSQGFNNGYYQTTSINSYSRITCTLSSAQIVNAYLNTNSVLSTSTMDIYYR